MPVVFVNFQPGNVQNPSGYLVDDGELFADRGNGFVYGWDRKNTSGTHDTNSMLSPDQRYDTYIATQKPTGLFWEIALPNGVYRVRLVAGAATGTGTMRYTAEGVSVVNAAQTNSVHWVEGTAIVTVNDGRLTLTNGAGSVNNKLCFVEIFR